MLILVPKALHLIYSINIIPLSKVYKNILGDSMDIVKEIFRHQCRLNLFRNNNYKVFTQRVNFQVHRYYIYASPTSQALFCTPAHSLGE